MIRYFLSLGSCATMLKRQRGIELQSKSFGNLSITPLDNRWFGGVTGLHSFTYGVLKIPSLICASTTVLKFCFVFLYEMIGVCSKITLSSGWF